VVNLCRKHYRRLRREQEYLRHEGMQPSGATNTVPDVATHDELCGH
jgi:hypothetical protein